MRVGCGLPVRARELSDTLCMRFHSVCSSSLRYFVLQKIHLNSIRSRLFGRRALNSSSVHKIQSWSTLKLFSFTFFSLLHWLLGEIRSQSILVRSVLSTHSVKSRLRQRPKAVAMQLHTFRFDNMRMTRTQSTDVVPRPIVAFHSTFSAAIHSCATNAREYRRARQECAAIIDFRFLWSFRNLSR